MRLTVTLVLAAVAAPAFAGPFGFEPGQTQAQIEAKIGKLDATSQPMLFVTHGAPVPLEGIESYALMIGKEAGLCKVAAVGVNIKDDDQGTALRAAYDELKAALTEKYGRPSKVREELASGSIRNEPDDFMMGLKLEERMHHAVWSKPSSPGVKAILLQARAMDGNIGYLNLIYEFPNFPDCSAGPEKRKTDAL